MKPIVRFSRKNALWLFLIAAAGLILIGAAAARMEEMFSGLSPQLGDFIVNLLYYLPFAVLAVCVSIRRKPEAAMSMRPNPISVWAAIYISSLAVLCVFFVSDISLLWYMPLQKLGLDVFKIRLAVPGDTTSLMLCVLTTAAIPGVCEELVFRGVVMSGFEDEGSSRALWISALLFALLHGSLTGLPGQLVLGLIIGMLVVAADSIYAGMIFHTVYNAAAVIIEFLQRDVPDALSRPDNIFAAVGGMEGVLLLLVEIALIGWMVRFSLNIFFLRGRLRGVRILSGAKKPFARDEKILLLGGAALVLILYAQNVAYMLM